ncbi:MAG: hypothetical protein AB7T86_10970 [Xanthobacteraceae bacterium]|uniref:hypothetical protein n=1 Tax=Pseudolabrys sp. TaxID=1960880 RepID=UPI003D0F5513
MANLFDYVPILPAALMVATIICLPLLADREPGSEEEERRIRHQKVMARISRGPTVPYVSQRRTRDDR